jgi:hypothetical protein
MREKAHMNDETLQHVDQLDVLTVPDADNPSAGSGAARDTCDIRACRWRSASPTTACERLKAIS